MLAMSSSLNDSSMVGNWLVCNVIIGCIVIHASMYLRLMSHLKTKRPCHKYPVHLLCSRFAFVCNVCFLFAPLSRFQSWAKFSSLVGGPSGSAALEPGRVANKQRCPSGFPLIAGGFNGQECSCRRSIRPQWHSGIHASQPGRHGSPRSLAGQKPLCLSGFLCFNLCGFYSLSPVSLSVSLSPAVMSSGHNNATGFVSCKLNSLAGRLRHRKKRKPSVLLLLDLVSSPSCHF